MTSKSRWLVVLAFSVIAGCSGGSDRPKTYPVSGTVKYKGSVVEGAVVTFELLEGKGSAIGSTDANGKYSLSSFSPSDGAVAGQYKVSVAKFVETKATTKPGTPPAGQIASGEIDVATYAPPSETGGGERNAAAGPKNLLPAKYANADSSALRAMVSATDKNVFDFELN